VLASLQTKQTGYSSSHNPNTTGLHLHASIILNHTRLTAHFETAGALSTLPCELVHDFTRSEPCLDVTASRDSGDVTDDRSRDSTRLRLEPIDAWRLGVQKTSARSAMKDSKRQRVSRLTVQLSSNSGGASASASGDGDSSPQHVNNKRRPRRRRIVCLSHSSLASSTTNDVTSPTHTPQTDHL